MNIQHKVPANYKAFQSQAKLIKVHKNKAMKNIIILITTLLCASCAVQKLDGVYYDSQSTSFACIRSDSVALVYKRSEWDDPCYFYGTFNRIHDTIVLGENLLRHDNAIVDTVYTEYSGIEIQLYELLPNIPIGAPTDHFDTFCELTKDIRVWWNYQFDSKWELFWRIQPNARAVDGIVQIPMETALSECSEDNEFLIKGYGFLTEQILELIPHTRYVIKQKTFNQNNRPMVPQEVPVVFNARKNLIGITESYAINYQPKRTFRLKYIGPADSCLGELRRRYPDL